MGLAASQARLLFITSRQNDVSAKMQRISNQTMILARDSEEVSDKYNRMLNATTLQLKSGTDLSYNALMGADALNNGTIASTLVTEASTNRIVLNSAMATALGLTDSTGNGADFISKTGIDSAEKLKEKLDATVTGATSSSSGNSSNYNERTQDVIANCKSHIIPTYGSYPTNKGTMTANDLLTKMGSQTFTYCTKNNANGGSVTLNYRNNCAYGNDYTIRISATEDTSSTDPAKNEASAKIKTIAGQIGQDVATALGIEYSVGFRKEVDEAIDKWADKDALRNLRADDGGHGSWSRAYDDADADAKAGLVGWDYDNTWDDTEYVILNVSELTRRIVDIALHYLSGNTDGWSAKTSVGEGKLSQDTKTYRLCYNEKGYNVDAYEQCVKDDIGVSEEATAAIEYLKDGKVTTQPPVDGSGNTGGDGGGGENSVPSYYTALYTQLTTYGWVIDNDANDSGKFNDKLKNQTYLLGVNREVLSNSDLYEEVADPDATAKAEAYWKTEMGKINRKEKKLDQELTKLQTEYSSLTTDYESVKSIIQANVSKSFTYCQNG